MSVYLFACAQELMAALVGNDNDVYPYDCIYVWLCLLCTLGQGEAGAKDGAGVEDEAWGAAQGMFFDSFVLFDLSCSSPL